MGVLSQRKHLVLRLRGGTYGADCRDVIHERPGLSWEAELALLPKKGISHMYTGVVKACSAYRAPFALKQLMSGGLLSKANLFQLLFRKHFGAGIAVFRVVMQKAL